MENEKKVTKDQMATLPYIIAVDFDGTLVADEFPYIGKAIESVWEKVKTAQSKGAKIIVIWRSLLKCQLACSDAVEMVMSCILGLLLPGPCLPLLCHLLPWTHQSLLIFAQCQSVHFKSPCAHS